MLVAFVSVLCVLHPLPLVSCRLVGTIVALHGGVCRKQWRRKAQTTFTPRTRCTPLDMADCRAACSHFCIYFCNMFCSAPIGSARGRVCTTSPGEQWVVASATKGQAVDRDMASADGSLWPWHALPGSQLHHSWSQQTKGCSCRFLFGLGARFRLPNLCWDWLR